MQAKPPRQRVKPVSFRVTQEEHATFTAEAFKRGMKLGTWIRAVLLQKMRMETKV